MLAEAFTCSNCGHAIETASDVVDAGSLPVVHPHREPMTGIEERTLYACVACGEPVGVS